MAYFTNCLATPITLTLALVATIASAEPPFTHAGRVVEVGKNSPVSADVKAWAGTRRTGDREACPVYGESALDSTVSSESDGSFRLKVIREKRTYTITYCKAGYYPRTDRDISNHKTGTPIVPLPANVFPRSYNKEVYDEAVKGKVIAAINDLVYLKSIDPRRFDELLAEVETQTYKRNVKFTGQLMDVLQQWER